jgi:hypothetical protein
MQSTLSRKYDDSSPDDLPESNVGIGLSSVEASERSTGEALAEHNRLNRSSVFQLAKDLVDEGKTLIRQELRLAKREISEKLSFLGRNAVGLGAGAGIAYAGAIVLLIGLGFLIAWAIHLAGIDGLLAAFLGLAGVGLLTLSIGGAFILKGVSALKAESLAPERTVQTLQGLTSGATEQKPKPPPAPKLPEASSAEMQARVEATEDHIGATLEELRYRLSPRNINKRIQRRIQGHPYRAGLLAMGAGLASGFAIRRRFGRA